MDQFENLQFSPELKPKKNFNWWKFVFNVLWISIVGLLFTLSSLSFFAYWNVYKSIPMDQTDFFVIFDKKFYDKNENWQMVGDAFVSHYLQLETDLWRSLLSVDQYFWGMYWEDSADIKPKLVFFSYSTLSDDLFSFLDKKGIAYSYKNKVLLLNSENLEQRKNVFPSFLMANNLCFGKFKTDQFYCDNNHSSIKVTVNGENYQQNGQFPDIFNVDKLGSDLLYADNQLVLADFPADIGENWLFPFPFLKDRAFSLLLWNHENPLFSKDFALFLTNTNNQQVLSDLQYYFAYQNRQFRDNVLADGSHYQDEVLDMENFSWKEYANSDLPVQSLLLNKESENFLYAYNFSENLILTTRPEVLVSENLFLTEDFLKVANFNYRKIFVGKLSWEKLLPFPLSLENCDKLKIEYQNSNYNFSLCD